MFGTLLFRQQLDEGRLKGFLSGLLQDFLSFTGRNDFAVIHGAEPVKLLRLFHVGGCDQHAHARTPGTNIGDQFPELPAGKRIDTRGGLVKDEEVGIVDQRAAQAELLLHSARKLACRTVDEGIEARCLEQLIHMALAFSVR